MLFIMNFPAQNIVQKILNSQPVINSVLNTSGVFSNFSSPFAILKIYTQNQELKQTYESVIEKHNEKIASSRFPDSGFDLYAPEDLVINKVNEAVFLDYQIKTEMLYYENKDSEARNTGYHMYPRSSFSKTPLILGNHVGVIDSGYRGNLMGAYKFFPNIVHPHEYTIKKDQRLVQVCHPSLCPIFVMLVDNDSFEVTERKDGGFGSTGV